MAQPLVELGGAGTPLHLAPANSFPLDTYGPLIEPLCDRFRVVALPPRALWSDPGPVPAEPGSWELMGEDLAAGIVHCDLRDVLAVGHSFGAVVSLVAAARRPERFRGLVMLDPTMLLQVQLDQVFGPNGNGVARHLFATRARDRRSEFDTELVAFEYWRPRSLFRDWSDDALWRYVRSALRPAAGGTGLTLVWSPDWEAHYYESLYEESWRELDRLDPGLPVLVIRGGTTDVFRPEAAERFRLARPSATVVDLPGHGHLFPLVAPEQTARIIADWASARSFRPTG